MVTGVLIGILAAVAGLWLIGLSVQVTTLAHQVKELEQIRDLQRQVNDHLIRATAVNGAPPPRELEHWLQALRAHGKTAGRRTH